MFSYHKTYFHDKLCVRFSFYYCSKQCLDYRSIYLESEHYRKHVNINLDRISHFVSGALNTCEWPHVYYLLSSAGFYKTLNLIIYTIVISDVNIIVQTYIERISENLGKLTESII
jgi:hypothetical protein